MFGMAFLFLSSVSHIFFHPVGMVCLHASLFIRIDEISVKLRMGVTDDAGGIESQHHKSCGVCIGGSTVLGDDG